MCKKPDYLKATNAAYDLLQSIRVSSIATFVTPVISSIPNTIAKSYNECCSKYPTTYDDLCCQSEYGFIIKSQTTKKNIILYNELKERETVRFTIAHEIGHIILDHSDEDDISNKEANCFARNFLCPLPVADNLGITHWTDYVDAFQVSEPMARVTVDRAKQDRYYISQENYQIIIEQFESCMLGYSPRFLIGLDYAQ